MIALVATILSLHEEEGEKSFAGLGDDGSWDGRI